MTELDQVWSQMLGDAAAKAFASGQRDIADYLRLKAANDAVRSAGVGWLTDTVVEIAGQELREHKTLAIEREEPHDFAHGNSNMIGTLLTIRYGVRCLTVEAGWTRTPRDGIMLNGALAYARFTHFGMPKMSAELRLVHGETLPNWIDNGEAVTDTHALKRHLDILLDKRPIE
ncbi:MAG: hypothetical protein IPL32_06550 [Chloracidobacterium sp.]|nr:hypothetical protein [Chloracidobacterium sp.]